MNRESSNRDDVGLGNEEIIQLKDDGREKNLQIDEISIKREFDIFIIVIFFLTVVIVFILLVFMLSKSEQRLDDSVNVRVWKSEIDYIGVYEVIDNK